MASRKRVPGESKFRTLLRRSERKADISFGKAVNSTLEALPPIPGVKLTSRAGQAYGSAECVRPQVQL